MSAKAVVYQRFTGGWSTDAKVGPKYSQAFTQALDFRKSPSQVSVLPGTEREDLGIVKDLILNEVMANNGVIYAFGDTGYIYKRTITAVWSEIGKLGSGTAGMDYRKDTDSIYLTTNKAVSLYNPVTGIGTPTLVPDKYGPSFSTSNNSDAVGFNVSAHQVGSSSTTAIAVATNPLAETTSNVRYFQSDIEPLNKIGVNVVSKGTGNWTLTLHDGLNNVLATSTISNANLKNNTINYFEFTNAPNGQVRIYVSPNARTYHFHLTSTVADGTVSSSIKNDLSSCDLEVWADRLVQTNNGLHPMGRFLQYEIIGNGNYLSVWEPLSNPPTNAEWLRHRLTFPEEYEVCGLAFTNEFTVIAAEQTTTTSNTPQEGMLFFWDGIDPTYNYNVRIPEGSPQALHTYKNVAYYYAGGSWWAITSVNTQPIQIRTMPGSDTEFSSLGTPTLIGASGNPLTATLSDNFNEAGTIPDTAKWDVFGNCSRVDGTLQMTTNLAAGSHGVNSHATNYDLTDSIIQIRLANAGNQALTSFEVFPLLAAIDTNNRIYWRVSQNNISAHKVVGGVSTQIATAAYIASTYQYLRIREVSGTVYWDYSSDGVEWTNFTSNANPITLTALTIEIQAGNFNVEASTTTAQFDDFNIIAPVSPITVYPYTATVRRGVHLMGYPSATISTTINYGVYSWGTIDKNYPESFGYSYLISTGSQNFSAQNNLMIGMVKAFGDLLHISWRDDTGGGYGIDIISNSSKPARYAKWQGLIFDNSYAAKLKSGAYMEVYYFLPENSSIQMAYSIDRNDFVVDTNVYTSTNKWQGQTGYARFNITADNGGRFHDIQPQFELRCDDSVTQPPVVYMVALVFDPNEQEALQ